MSDLQKPVGASQSQGQSQTPLVQPDWPNIAISDSYRTSTPAQQAGIKLAWLRDTMPLLYPEAMTNPLLRGAVIKSMMDFNLPAKVKDEDSVLTPDTFSSNNFASVERNPVYIKSSYADQQTLKSIWYQKTSVLDQEFRSIPPKNQEEFYNSLMRRGPAHTTGLFLGYSPAEAQKSFDASTRAGQATKVVATNLFTSFGESLTDLFTGPARLLLGDESLIAHIMDDVEKNREWVNNISDTNDFFTKTLPSLVGYGGGFAVGPWGKINKALSGGVELVKGAETAAGLIKLTPGLIERGATKLGIKAPSIAFQSLGGALAGAGQGITDALSQGKPWHTNLIGNAAMGLGMEFATRYVGLFQTLRKAAKELGVDPRNASSLFRTPLELGSGKILSPELDALMKSNPEYKRAIFNMYSTDKNGILTKNLYTTQGVELVANTLGFEVKDSSEGLQILREGKVIQTFDHGDPTVRIDKAHGWLDAQSGAAQEAWQNTSATKKISEAVMTAPKMYARQVTFIPEAARSHIADFFNQHGITGFDYRLNPDRSAGLQQIDDVFDLLRSRKSLKDITAALGSRGIKFSDYSKENVATVKQLRFNLDQLMPQGSYLVVDRAQPNNSRLAIPEVPGTLKSIPVEQFSPGKRADGTFGPSDVPTVYLEAPDKYEPSMNNKLFIGDGTQIRNQFAYEAKVNQNRNAQLGKKAAGLGMSYRKFTDSQIIELTIPFKDAQGNQTFAVLHSPSMKAAVELLSRGRIKTPAGIQGHFFGDNPVLMKQYDGYLKRVKKQMGSDWVSTNWMPFQYVAAQAKQNNFYLGLYKGTYILQDILHTEPQWKTFKDLTSVIDYLNSNESRLGRPSLDGNLSIDAINEMYPEGIKDPLSELNALPIKTKKRMGIGMALGTKLNTTPNMMDSFAKLKAIQDTGIDPVNMMHKLTDMTTMLNDFTSVRTRWISEWSKGLKDDEAKMIHQWIESNDTPRDALIKAGQPLNEPPDEIMSRFKGDVEKEMEGLFGKTRADELISKGVQLGRYYNDLFSASGMDWTMFVKHYFPHVRTEVAKDAGGVSNHLSSRLFKGIPDEHKKMFFEFMRDTDPKDFVLNDNVVDVTKMYTHMMARKVFTRPIAQMIGDEVRIINKAYTVLGKTPRDYVAFENYIAGVLQSVEGISGPVERDFQNAIDNTVEELVGRLQGVFNKEKEFRGKYKLLSNLATIAAGGQLAGRPYPIFKNFTQSLVTGGPVIGPKWWLEGFDRATQPGAMARMEAIGLTSPNNLPIATSQDISRGKFGNVVRTAMKPYKFADDFNRTLIYHGMEARVQDALQLLSERKINAKQFLVKSGANLFGRAEENYLVGVLNKGGDPTGFTHQLAKLATERTQFLYESFNQPSLFRGGFGRLAGQYTSWPINMIGLVKSRIASDSLTVGQRITFFAELAAITGSIAAGMNSVGISPRQWAPWNMVLFQGGPYYQLVNDMFGFLNGSREGLQGIARTMTSLVPFGLEGQGVMQAYQAMQDGEWYEAAVHLFGAPLRTDLYPKRKTVSDNITQKIIDAGNVYLKAQGFMK